MGNETSHKATKPQLTATADGLRSEKQTGLQYTLDNAQRQNTSLQGSALDATATIGEQYSVTLPKGAGHVLDTTTSLKDILHRSETGENTQPSIAQTQRVSKER